MAKFKFKIAEKEYETNDEAEYRRWTEAEKAWLSGAVLREAASVSSGAALTRSRTPLYNAEGERVGTFAQDASPSIAQLTEPEIPVASLKSDLKRKRSLHSVMPKPEAEGLLDELLGDCADEDKDSERSEEHTSELQSLAYLVCRLLLEKKKKNEIICINIKNEYNSRR